MLENDVDLIKGKIETELARFLDEKIGEAHKVSPASERLIKNVKEFALRRGKRIRPLLVVYGYKCIRTKSENEIIKASISTELLHDYLLIHDDIMDESDLRRGEPTFHKIYEKYYAGRGFKKSSTYAVNSAILAGDVLAALSVEPILETSFPAELKSKAVKKFIQTNCLTGYGQELDLLLELAENPSLNDVEAVQTLKTAKYTFEGPLHIGAILANATEKELKTLTEFSIPAGRAFQIQDDILGFFGSREAIGKPIDSDLKEGKKTLLTLLALQNGTKKQRTNLNKILGNPSITMKDVEEARQIVTETGSLEYSRKLAKKLAAQAFTSIKKSNFNKPAKEFLASLAGKIVSREN